MGRRRPLLKMRAESASAQVAAGSPDPAVVAGGLSLNRTGGGVLRGIKAIQAFQS